MSTRVSNLASNKLIQSTILRTQDRILDRQLQISTLQKSQDYAGIADETNRLVTMEASRRKVEQYMSESANVKLRMDSMLNSLDSLKETLKDVEGMVRDLLDDGTLPDGMDKDSFASVKIAEIEDFLNVKVGGRFLFSGSVTETKPVDIPDPITAPAGLDAAPFNTVAEPSFYYQGDGTKLKARLNEGLEVQYGVTADDPAFEKLIRAVRILRSTPLSDPNIKVIMQEAADLCSEAKSGMEAVELNVGTKLEQLGRTQTTLKNSKNFMDGVVSDLESADTTTAVAELTQDQTMLEASYNVLVRLSKLNLNSYLGI
ncbi:MAG: flgL [Rhodospirillales bacterium]|jgi:flagellar hook-associated protein 3 FlgL|nr:flgL [Rhodospirillales bacterium]